MKWDEIPRLSSCRHSGVDVQLFRYFCHYIDEEVPAGPVLRPDFRRGDVWTAEQQTACIEYLLRGGLSGRTIYLNAKNTGILSPETQDYVCVDGLQRITAIQRFCHDEIPAFGHLYSQFEGRPDLTKFTVRVVTNDLQSHEEVLQWYLELNSAGTPHSKEELDRAGILLNREREIHGLQKTTVPAVRRQAQSPSGGFPAKKKRPER